MILDRGSIQPMCQRLGRSGGVEGSCLQAFSRRRRGRRSTRRWQASPSLSFLDACLGCSTSGGDAVRGHVAPLEIRLNAVIVHSVTVSPASAARSASNRSSMYGKTSSYSGTRSHGATAPLRMADHG